MSFNHDKILENIRERKRLEQELGDSLSELSSGDEDSQDASFIEKTSKGKTTSGEEIATKFFESEAFKTIIKDRRTVNGSYEKKKILLTNRTHHVLTCEEDCKLLSGEMTMMDVILLSSQSYNLSCHFDELISNMIDNCEHPYKAINRPTIDQCLSWLSSACQCSLHLLLPSGEVFPIAENLVLSNKCTSLSIVDEHKQRLSIAKIQIIRTFEMLSICDYSCLTPAERAVLAFAISSIILDENYPSECGFITVKALEKVLNCPSNNTHEVIIEFSKIFQYISDDISALRVVFQSIRLTSPNVNPICCLVIINALFVHITERGECAPEEALSETVFIREHLKTFTEVFNDVLEQYATEKNTILSIVMMMDAAITPYVWKKADNHIKRRIMDKLNVFKREMSLCVSPDEAIIDKLVRTFLRRLELLSPHQAY